MKEIRFDPESKLTRLVECWTSKASCRQRRGRAGRVKAGTCLKLFSKSMQRMYLDDFTTPEIQRISLEALFLNIKAIREEEDCIVRI